MLKIQILQKYLKYKNEYIKISLLGFKDNFYHND